jgi:hypothetical protein
MNRLNAADGRRRLKLFRQLKQAYCSGIPMLFMWGS